MKEMRVKSEYESHDFIHAAMGLKISAPGLEDAVAGSALFLANTPEEYDNAMNEVEQ
jgi:translation initiation factor IF-2